MYILTESFKQLDAVYYFDTDSDYFDILETCWQESKEEVRVKSLVLFMRYLRRILVLRFLTGLQRLPLLLWQGKSAFHPFHSIFLAMAGFATLSSTASTHRTRLLFSSSSSSEQCMPTSTMRSSEK